MKQMCGWIAACGVACGVTAAAIAQPNTGFTITHGDAVFVQGVSPSGTQGPVGTGASGATFRANGSSSLDHVYQNWWWARVNGVETREFALANATGTVTTSDTAVTTWTFSSYTLRLTYLVRDTGNNAAQVTQTMEVTNTGTEPLSLALMAYADFDVGATSSGDSAVLMGPDTIRITDISGVYAEFEGLNADLYQVGAYQTVRLLLTDEDVDDLGDTGAPFDAGDWTGAFQWNLTVEPGAAATVRAYMRLNQPASLGACCTGLEQCQLLHPLNCTAVGGSYRGDGSLCTTPTICGVIPTGVCCTSTCACTVMREADCVAAGGTYRGNGTTCRQFACFPTPACSCDWNGDATLNSQDFLDFVTAFFADVGDYNCDGATNSQDFFDFVGCFFTPPEACGA